MKYVKKFDSFTNQRSQPINEELLGGIINFFKNMWNKAVEEIKKLGKNPSPDQVEQWVDKNPMNPADDGYIFKPQMEEFKKKTEANEQDCLDLIQNLLDPQTGCLGVSGLQPLYDGITKSFGKETPTIDIVRYYMETIRNRAIKDYKYGGGPDLKVGTNPKIEPAKLNKDMTDKTHLPKFKEVLLKAGQDKKKVCIDWVEKTLLPRLDTYAAEVTDKQIFEEGTRGKIKMEVIAEGTVFTPWEDDFEVKMSKKVMIKFNESKTNSNKPKTIIKPGVKVNFKK